MELVASFSVESVNEYCVCVVVASPTKISLVMSRSHGGPGQQGEGLLGGGATMTGMPAAPGTGHFHAYPLMVPGNKIRPPPLARAIPHRR